MKTLEEFKAKYDTKLKVNELAMSFKSFITKNIDFDVFLPTFNRNLQRNYVWSIGKKREIIISMLIERNIPHLSIINRIKDNNAKSHSADNEILEIIDGKQRLSSMIDFYNNKFTIVIDDIEYFFRDLPNDFQVKIRNCNIRFHNCYEDYDNPITCEQKDAWYDLINFGGVLHEENNSLTDK